MIHILETSTFLGKLESDECLPAWTAVGFRTTNGRQVRVTWESDREDVSDATAQGTRDILPASVPVTDRFDRYQHTSNPYSPTLARWIMSEESVALNQLRIFMARRSSLQKTVLQRWQQELTLEDRTSWMGTSSMCSSGVRSTSGFHPLRTR